MSDPVTIQLGLTRPALERLLGGDNELTIKLSQQVIKKFLEKHTKELIATVEVDNIIRSAKDQIHKDIEKKLGKWEQKKNDRGWNVSKEFKLSKEIESKIEKAILNIVGDIVEEYVNKIDMKKLVEKTVDYQVDARIRRGVRARLDSFLQQNK